ncbi:putative multidrug ABC transporter permease YbhR [Anaerolineales bacterium]|nr:putative multidrug ABC transporter permease YbhR [Anaerolineales bacterium]
MTRLWSVFRKSVREQKRDLWVVGLSLAFAPLFVFIYWMMTGGASGSTSFGVLVINRDIPALQVDGSTLSAGQQVVDGLREKKYENGGSLLRVTEVSDQADAETRLRNREAAALVIIPEDFSERLSAFRAGDLSANTDLTFIGDLTNPTYTVAAVMAMTVADNYTQEITSAARPVNLVEIPLGNSAARTEFENYVPGLLVLAVVLMIFQAAMTPARDIETGAMKRLRLTRLTSFEYLGGTVLWLALVSVGSVLLTFLTAVAFGFRSQGPLWLAFVIAAITSLSIIGIGLLVACFSKTVSQAFVIANFPLGFLMFLTGAAFPLPRMNLFTIEGRSIALADFLPPSHAVVALNKIFTLGAGFGDVLYELTALVILTGLYFGVGVWLFQRTQMK